jgi:hypothetical protein
MNTKRAPEWQITERAVGLYRRMRVLDPETSEEFWQLHDYLRAELCAPPWVWPLTSDAALVAMLEAAVAERAIR